MKRLRYRLGVRLLRPYLLKRLWEADVDLAAERDHDSRRGGYKQGVRSTLSNVLRLR